jgi:1-aminocyclopropane-1-carboxylate deaminase
MIKVFPEIFLLPSPCEKVIHNSLEKHEIKLFVKRDDLIHHEISGNKYRKLKYNLEYILNNNISSIITFGGAYSNHLYATAALCNYYGLQSYGVVRGDGLDPDNPTLQFCIKNGMTLHFVCREEYRNKNNSSVVKKIIAQYNSAYVIPEGGSNQLSLLGVEEIWSELSVQLDKTPDYLFCAIGTGTTIAGLLKSAPDKCKLLGFPVLKTNHLEKEVLTLAGENKKGNLSCHMDYHFGGYAKTTDQLRNFIKEFEAQTGIPIDTVYNAKALYGFFDLVEKGLITKGSTIVWLHTGGLQGNDGMQYMISKKQD